MQAWSPFLSRCRRLRPGHADLVRDRPDKAGELTGDGCGDGRDRFAGPAELAILKAEPLLRLPGDRPDRCGELLLT